MKQLYVDDYVGTILSAWYTRAALWVPGEGGPEALISCELCSGSPLADVIDVTAWPHELIHHLAFTLGAALGHVEISVAEDSRTGSAMSRLTVPITARRMMTTSLRARSAEMSDVLENCVLYRIEDRELMDLERSLLG